MDDELGGFVADVIDEVGGRSCESVAELEEVVRDAVRGLRLAPWVDGLVMEMVKEKLGG